MRLGPETYDAPAAPGAGQTIVLYRHDCFGLGARSRPMRVVVDFVRLSHASASNGLRAYTKYSPGGSLREVKFGGLLPYTVPATTGDDDEVHDFEVATYPYFEVQFTANSAPTTWELVITKIFGVRDRGR